MAKGKNNTDEGYKELQRDLRAGTPKRVYAFWGEERYLLERSLDELRRMIPEGTEEFNHKRFDGRGLSMSALADAVDALPVFSERTLTEVSGFDFAKLGEEARRELTEILSDMPDYACLVFILGTEEFKLDGRVKANVELKKLITSVEFQVQEMNALLPWISKHFEACGKHVGQEAAERLVSMTGGLMTGLNTEIEKLVSYCAGDTVTVRDVEAVVTPVLDAVAYQLTDAMLSGSSDLAIEKLGELLLMNEPPHKVLFSISMKLRQLLCARICIDSGMNMGEFMRLCGIRYEFQARSIFAIARRKSIPDCSRLVLLSVDTAYKLNSSPQDGGELLRELLVRILLMDGVRK